MPSAVRNLARLLRTTGPAILDTVPYAVANAVELYPSVVGLALVKTGQISRVIPVG
jgi:hypothetical protein